MTFQSRVRRSNHCAIPAPTVVIIKYSIKSKVWPRGEDSRGCRFESLLGLRVLPDTLNFHRRHRLSVNDISLSVIASTGYGNAERKREKKEEEKKEVGSFGHPYQFFHSPFLPLPAPCTTYKLTNDWTAINQSMLVILIYRRVSANRKSKILICPSLNFVHAR